MKPVHWKKHGKAARKSQTVDRSKHIGADVFSRIDDPIQVNRVNRYVPSVSSRAAGARKYVPERREKDVSDKHSVVKQFRQNCGPGYADGNNDTCVGYTSQSRTPRHKNGGRHGKSYGAAGPPPSALPLINNMIYKNPHMVLCGFCCVMSRNTSHGENYF